MKPGLRLGMLVRWQIVGDHMDDPTYPSFGLDGIQEAQETRDALLQEPLLQPPHTSLALRTICAHQTSTIGGARIHNDILAHPQTRAGPTAS